MNSSPEPRHACARRDVLVGTEVVDWMLQKPWCRDREHAVEVGQTLVDAGFLHHVTYDHPFRDAVLFYRWHGRAPTDDALNAAERAATEYVA